MWKKITATLLALGFLTAANCNLCVSLNVAGSETEELYSRKALERGMSAANAAMEEIARGEAKEVAAAKSYTLRLAPPTGSSRQISEAVLQASGDVMSTYGVYVDGKRLGSVADETALRERLDRFVTGQMPTWAVRGGVSRHVDIHREYSRVEPYTTLDDMVLLISGAAPVLYTDGSGYVSRA